MTKDINIDQYRHETGAEERKNDVIIKISIIYSNQQNSHGKNSEWEKFCRITTYIVATYKVEQDLKHTRTIHNTLSGDLYTYVYIQNLFIIIL